MRHHPANHWRTVRGADCRTARRIRRTVDRRPHTPPAAFHPNLPLPCLVVATGAIRDEGTSLHYLPAAGEVSCPAPEFAHHVFQELAATGHPVRQGKVWTTDAPYRETQVQLEEWAAEGILAVEMQAASLFAFGIAKGVALISIAMVSNAVDHDGE